MKTLLLALLALVSALPVQGQVFGSGSLGGALLGGIAGGVIGHNNGRKTAEGIAIGAGTGLLLGALTDRYRQDRAYATGPAPYYGYGYGDAHPVIGYGQPVYGSGFFPGPQPFGFHQRHRYATSGALLGGIAGGVIGHNNGRRTAEGVAIGAGTGLLLGALADQSLRRPVAVAQPVPVYVSPTVRYAPAEAAPAASPAPTTSITIINNYYGSGGNMGGANSLFGR